MEKARGQGQTQFLRLLENMWRQLIGTVEVGKACAMKMNDWKNVLYPSFQSYFCAIFVVQREIQDMERCFSWLSWMWIKCASNISNVVVFLKRKLRLSFSFFTLCFSSSFSLNSFKYLFSLLYFLISFPMWSLTYLSTSAGYPLLPGVTNHLLLPCSAVGSSLAPTSLARPELRTGSGASEKPQRGAQSHASRPVGIAAVLHMWPGGPGHRSACGCAADGERGSGGRGGEEEEEWKSLHFCGLFSGIEVTPMICVILTSSYMSWLLSLQFLTWNDLLNFAGEQRTSTEGISLSADQTLFFLFQNKPIGSWRNTFC